MKELDIKNITVLGSGGWMNGQEPWKGYFERTGEIKKGMPIFTLSLKTISYIPEIEEAYYFENGQAVAKYPMLDLTYDTNYAKGLKDSNYWLGNPFDLEKETTYKYIIDGTELRFKFNAENNYGLQKPIQEIIKKCEVPDVKNFTGLFAPGCLPKTDIINATPKDRAKKIFKLLENEKELVSFIIEFER
ncbi:MAG: hypothetical protein JXQ74_01160 [Alphaproteobacteria bacterium]|nr:hypothetical protein [Alphaproteobacteria bacterium]